MHAHGALKALAAGLHFNGPVVAGHVVSGAQRLRAAPVLVLFAKFREVVRSPGVAVFQEWKAMAALESKDDGDEEECFTPRQARQRFTNFCVRAVPSICRGYIPGAKSPRRETSCCARVG